MVVIVFSRILNAYIRLHPCVIGYFTRLEIINYIRFFNVNAIPIFIVFKICILYAEFNSPENPNQAPDY